ncbi:MAG: hypothetical protein AAFQ94_03475 [Bacteroidota bacterium]
MRYITLFIYFFTTSFMISGQPSDIVIVANSYDDLKSQLENVQHKEAVKKLSVILQRSRDHWYVMPIIGGKYDYEHPTFTIQDPISELPAVIWEFKNVEFLDVSTLGLKTLSDSMLNMTELQTLNIAENYLNIEENVSLLLELPALKTLVAFSCPVSQIAITYLKDAEENIDFLYTNSDYATYAEEYFGWKSDYIEADFKESLSLELLQVIQHYYPVGMSSYNGIYPGFKKLSTLLEDAANERINNYKSTKAAQLVERLRIEHSALAIRDLTNTGRPATQIQVSTETKTGNGVTERITLDIAISTISNYFTVYFLSFVTFDNYTEYLGPIRHYMYRGEKNASMTEKSLMNDVITSIKAVYTDYQFVNHHLLMKTEIEGGMPRTEGGEIFGRKFPISSFLFGITPLRGSKVIK